MVRDLFPVARRAGALAVLAALLALAGCGVKGPLKPPAGTTNLPAPPPAGVDLPSAVERRE